MARIAFVAPNMGGGGAERVVLTLVEAFLQRGHEVDLVLMRRQGELLSLLPPQVRVFDLNANRIRGALIPLVKYLRERRPHSLQAILWSLTVVAIIAGVIARTATRIIVADHGILSRQYGRSRAAMFALRLTTRFIYPLAAARICVSEGCATDLARLSGLNREHFTVIHNPVSAPSDLQRSRPDVEQLWANSERRILTVGSLKAVKNHDLLLRAFAQLDKNRDARLMILGEGELRPSIERLAEDLGIADRLIMPGFAIDPWPYYLSADLFVLTSNNEAYPLVLVEALLAGLTVVSTDCAYGPREILDGGRFGHLVPVGDTKSLVETMSAALEQPHQLQDSQNWARKLGADSIDQYQRFMVDG